VIQLFAAFRRDKLAKKESPVLFDTPRSLQKLTDLAADAARRKSELVVFPEAFVGGYRNRNRCCGLA
jgi:predicted amidohydrolase